MPGHTIKDSHAPRKSIMSAKYAFEQSSNVAITKLVNTHYKDDPSKFTDKLYSMGLGKALQLQIPGKENLRLKRLKRSPGVSSL